jgi:HEAT repeat protein
MTQMEDWLAGGDLRSDGASNEVADLVRSQLDLLPELLGALESTDPVVRGRAADALEKVARHKPDAIVPHVDRLISFSLKDSVPMVRWHVAMLLGHLAVDARLRPRIQDALLPLLDDESVFVASWAVTSLCLVAYLDPGMTNDTVQAIGRVQGSASAALRTRARKALAALTDPGADLPADWIKSERVRKMIGPSVPDSSA